MSHTSHSKEPEDAEKSSTAAFSQKSDVDIHWKGLDVAVGLAAGHADDPEISAKESRRLRNKLDRHLLPLLFLIYVVQFIDKGTLASSSILGIIKDNHLTTDQFNTLNSAFYIGFLVFEWPQNWALQRFPVGKWITFNVFLWCVFLGLQPLCHNFGGLFVLRFLLGASEGCITAGLMLVTSMFYTRTEIGERIGWTFQCNGVGTILNGFLTFAAFHAPATGRPKQWQLLMIVTLAMTFITLVLFLFFFPDNPTTAHFLTPEEKLKCIKRTQGNQNGIETKVWKKRQFIEAITDIKVWLFFLSAAVADLQNGFGVQYNLIINSLGFTRLQTTLLFIPSGVTQIIGITTACYLLRRFPNSRAWINILFWVPPLIGILIQIFLPFHNKVGHLIGIYIITLGGAPSFVMTISWVASAFAGHTKKLTANGIFLVGYALGQILCTQFWRDKYKPRNIVPWVIILVTIFANVAITLLIRHVLVTENTRRDALKAEAKASGKSMAEFGDFGYVDSVDEKGIHAKVKIERSLLDLTDKENLAFRYVL